ncbi:rhamnose ABC transporter substrate-binding protein [Alginatibacterium sediminis]|uniref:Rhamnose ABC transporter substrate-binding protein n=1 Tax=Alginatibacterium sediminis TaxID=2164068 RepID=A0A420EB04_9ALTE|nr:rhamnose ABC transporter substrate-binding protein [Alginatibacterium sediminis]RKF17868.1 rhamnose ABC transporter substrate-binding protein [Alginatibacterium sediminis]
MKLTTIIKTTLIATSIMASTFAQAADMRIGLVVKAQGIGFFEAAYKGAQEASAEIEDNIEIIYTGPVTPTAEGQIEIINSLISQKVDAIVVSANDPDALVPILKRAQQRGIKVVSFDSGVATAGRQIHLNPSSNELIGRMNIELAATSLEAAKSEKGDIAILSASPTATNQNIWIGEMEKALPEFPQLTLVATVYGDDLADKSYRETQGLVKTYPNLKVIVAPTTVGILAAAQAITDMKKTGEVFVTGLGLPSELAGHVESGAVNSFAIWNPIDLGYAATHIAYNLIQDTASETEVEMGRMGVAQLDAEGNAAMSSPFVYDISNVAEFAKIF